MEYRTLDALCGIYKITNIINLKVYIGQSINIKARWKDHINALNRGDSRCTLLQRAWIKYGGEENFTFEILELCPEDMLDEIETKYIEIYDARNNGYNIEPGGNQNKHLSNETKQKIREAHLGKKMSDETRKKMSDSRLGEKNPMYGQTHSEAARKKISDAAKRRPGNRPSKDGLERIRKANVGKVLSDECRAKISKSNMGKIPVNRNPRPVYCIELQRVFSYPAAAGKELKIRSSNIISCCEHIRKTCGGCHWMYADSDEYTEFINTLTTQNE